MVPKAGEPLAQQWMLGVVAPSSGQASAAPQQM